MSDLNLPLHKHLLTLGIFTELKGNTVHMNLDRIAARRFMDNYNAYKPVLESNGANKRTLNHISELFSRTGDWVGGTKDDLVNDLDGNIEMAPYTEQYQKLEENDLMSKLKTAGALSKPRRKRRMSEHEGDWDFERMWELKPYQHCVRMRSIINIVKIDAHFACSGATKSHEITKYGGLVWAISKIIEDAGIQTEITYCERAKNVGYNGTGIETRMLIKKPGEYIAPSFLAATFTSNHYRRLGFALQALCVPINDNDQSCDSMGSATPGAAMQFEDGRLTMDVRSNRLNFSEVERVIMQIIGKENNG